MQGALREHWPEYLMEAGELGAFMLASCLLAALLNAPGSPVARALPDPLARRALMAAGSGLAIMAIVYSPWGGRSGAHMNPGVTLTFWRLGRVATADALGYAAAQVAGGIAGVALAALLAGPAVAGPPVRFLVTVPGPGGAGLAFAAEIAISFLLMIAILLTMAWPRAAHLTGVAVGILVALIVVAEAPLSGASMNPARTLGSALPARVWTALWVYLLGPPLGMLLAAETFARVRGRHHLRTAKLHHPRGRRCIFRCDHPSHAAEP